MSGLGFVFDKIILSRKDPVYTSMYECERTAEFTLRERCYLFSAISYNSTFPCDRMNDLYGLKDECYFEVAKLKKDTNICKKIKSELKKEECSSIKNS